MLYAAIDIHKSVFQVAVLESEGGEFAEQRIEASPQALAEWAASWAGRVRDVAIEATTGWRWVAASLQQHGFRVHLVDPAEASARRGRRRKPKTDRLDARWLVLLLAGGQAPESWLAPEEIQRLRDLTRLRRRLADDRRRWAQRLHALLVQEGWPCQKGRLLTGPGRRWLAGLKLHPAARRQLETMLAVIDLLADELEPLERELRAFARADARTRALQQIFGVGQLLACHLLAEIGEASRFPHPRKLVRAAGLDPSVRDSGDRRRRGRLSKQGSPFLRWALVEAAQHGRRRSSPDRARYARLRARSGAAPAKLTLARLIAYRAFHLLRALEAQPA